MNLPQLLQRLSEIEPAVCRHIGPHYYIGQYWFFISGDGELGAFYDVNAAVFRSAKGQPALDWLAGAVMRECERRGWDYSHHTSVTQGRYHFAAICNRPGSLEAIHSPNEHISTSAHALLAAFVAAVEAAK